MTLYAPEHHDLRATVRRLFERSADSAAIRAVLDSPEAYDHALWQRMSGELGLPGLAVAEEHGGSGFGVTELAVVLEEIGRVNLPSPYLSTVLSGLAIALTDTDETTAGVLTGIASGERIATTKLGADVHVEDGAAYGTAPHVLDGAAADVLVLVSSMGGHVVDLHAPGVDITALETIDLTRGQAHIVLDGVTAHGLSAAEPGLWAARVQALATTLLAAEQIGGAERCVELSTAYAADRVQFGRPIGSFQAVKHLCADMLIELELARATEQHAVELAATAAGFDEFGEAAELAKVACSRAFSGITADTIQVHGGVGYTWEHDAHLYFRRARAAAQLFGRVAAHADRLATHAGL